MDILKLLKKTCIVALMYLLNIGHTMADNQNKSHYETAVLAGGCFWGVEKLFSELDGVIDVVNGYTGGDLDNPTYDDITTGTTGHAEAVQVTYNPAVISYEKLLKFFFKIHDPTTLNKQKNDIGTQYRSAIFYTSLEQKNIAYNVINTGNQSGVFKNPIVTKLEKLEKFYPAEEYHQNYLQKNPYGYTCHAIHDEWSF
jgi:methionine-S-sulfoxide reductase